MKVMPSEFSWVSQSTFYYTIAKSVMVAIRFKILKSKSSFSFFVKILLCSDRKRFPLLIIRRSIISGSVVQDK